MVLIAGRDRLESLTERLASAGEVLALNESEVHRAFEILARHRPSQFVLERFFAATPRGAALLTRLRTDPTLADLEIRVVAHDSDYSRVVAHRLGDPSTAPGASPAEISSTPPPVPNRSLDPGGTRQTGRFTGPAGVEVQVDGQPVTLVDLSDGGAQVTSATVLRPNQRVRVSISWQQDTARAGATITWANFELSRESKSPQYRAGLTFNPGEADAIDALTGKWRD